MGIDKTKRCVVFALALATALLFGAVALAKSTTLTGTFDGDGRVEVKLLTVKRHGERELRVEFSFHHITVRCDGDGQQRLTPALDGRNKGPHSDEEFGYSIVGDGYEANMFGRFDSKTEAHGYVEISGKRVPLKGGGHADCKSGKLKWTASA